MRRGALFILALPVLALMTAGCGGEREGRPVLSWADKSESPPAFLPGGSAKGKEAEVLDDGGLVARKRKGKDFSFAAGGKVGLPANYPDDVPLYPRARIALAQKGEALDATVILDVEASPDEAVGFYRREMDTRGWKVTGEARLEGQQFLSFSKDGRRYVTVNVSPEKGRSIVSIVHLVKRAR